jgi:hypothetical protein
MLTGIVIVIGTVIDSAVLLAVARATRKWWKQNWGAGAANRRRSQLRIRRSNLVSTSVSFEALRRSRENSVQGR